MAIGSSTEALAFPTYFTIWSICSVIHLERACYASRALPLAEYLNMPQISSSTPFSGIFVSYRRDDSSGHAGRLFDNLVSHFGRERIFMDIDTIEPGEDFVSVIENAVGSCDLLIAVIGQNWLRGTTGGTGRLDDPNDFVRLEIAAALDRDIRVIPVLVQRAAMPLQRDLPDNLTKLARRNAIELSDLRWQNDVEQLITVMDKVLAKREQARLAKAARDAEAKRQSEAEAESRRLEEEKRRLLSEEEAKRKADEQAKRETEERERLAQAEKRRIEEERQKAYEEGVIEKARREAEEQARVALAEKRRVEEESRRQQNALAEKKSEPDSGGFAPNLIPATNASDSPIISAPTDLPLGDEANQTRTRRLIIIAAIALVAVVALVVSIVLLRPRRTNPVVSVGGSASPIPSLNPSPTPTPNLTPDKEAFERSLTTYIKERLSEGEAEVKENRRVVYGDLNADKVEDAVMSYCANVPLDPSRNRYCEVTVFRDESGVLKYLANFRYEGVDGKDQSLLATSIKKSKIVSRVLTYLDDGTVDPNDKSWMNLALDGDKLKKSK